MKAHKTKRRLSAACHYAYTRLALNYYMYYEVVSECSLLDNKLEPLIAEYHKLLTHFLEGSRDAGRLDNLRNQVIHEMEVNTAYTDAFQAYEYVLNRLEERFEPQLVGARVRPVNEKAAAAEIMSYITDTEDPMVMRERIQSVLGQLPVRLTRQKFFSIIAESLRVYAGGTRESLDDVLYILRSEALLNQPGDMDSGYEELHSILKECSGADYKEMTPEQYRHLTREIERAGDILTDNSGEIMLFMDLINDLYVLFLSRDSVLMDVGEESRLREILKGVLELFLEDGQTPIPRVLTEKLSFLEGKQETYFEQWMREGREEDGEDEAQRSRIELLMSGSSFMPLQKEGDKKASMVDELMLSKELESLFLDLSQCFANQPRQFTRAVMAKILSRLPIFFRTLEETEKFIVNSLESCPDEGEKQVSIRLIRLLMEQDGFEAEDD